MVNIDNMINSILSKGKSKRQSLGLNINLILGKSPKTDFGMKSIIGKPLKMNFGMNSSLNKPLKGKPLKGASIRKQNQWKSFSPNFKSILRQRLPDRDKDRVPDRYDCQPCNRFKQEDDKYISKEKKLFSVGLKKATKNNKDITFNKPMFIISTYDPTDGREEGCGCDDEIETILEHLKIKYKNYSIEREDKEEYGNSGIIYIFVVDTGNKKDLKMLKNVLRQSEKDSIQIGDENIAIGDEGMHTFILPPGTPLYKEAWGGGL